MAAVAGCRTKRLAPRVIIVASRQWRSRRQSLAPDVAGSYAASAKRARSAVLESRTQHGQAPRLEAMTVSGQPSRANGSSAIRTAASASTARSIRKILNARSVAFEPMPNASITSKRLKPAERSLLARICKAFARAATFAKGLLEKAHLDESR